MPQCDSGGQWGGGGLFRLDLMFFKCGELNWLNKEAEFDYFILGD